VDDTQSNEEIGPVEQHGKKENREGRKEPWGKKEKARANNLKGARGGNYLKVNSNNKNNEREALRKQNGNNPSELRKRRRMLKKGGGERRGIRKREKNLT